MTRALRLRDHLGRWVASVLGWEMDGATMARIAKRFGMVWAYRIEVRGEHE